MLVGLSGGVDSSVAACMLVRQGFEVTGLHLQLHAEGEDATRPEPMEMRISDRKEFDIPVYRFNLSGRFRREVEDYFREEYLAAHTPNPCMLCNKTVKWAGLLEAARLLDAELVSTGHYARTAFREGRHRLLAGLDPKKDQSYFLWMLSEEEIARTLFPLGEHTKQEVRELARSFGVTAAEKKESQEICFIPGDDYRSWLAASVPGLRERLEGGGILDPSGKLIGSHHGYPFYTVGQRRGLGTATGEPVYVTSIDPETNTLHTGPRSALLSTTLRVGRLNWIAFDPPAAPFEATARIRYRDTAAPCTLTPKEGGEIEVVFAEPKSALTPGQAAVFYRGEEVLGGGIITDAGPAAGKES